MKLWISGEVDAQVGDFFRKTLNIVEEKVNEKLDLNYYGLSIESWDVIFIISEDGGVNKLKFDEKKKETDIKYVINYFEFLNASASEREKIFYESLIDGVSNLSTKYNIKDLNLDKLINDIKKIYEI